VTDDAPASLAKLTAETVSAYVANNKIALPDVATLISAVGSQMAKIGTEVEPPTEEKPEPAVPVRRSIQPHHLVCLVCGQPQKVLKRHLAVQHGLTPTQYRERFGLKPEYPMAAPNYAHQRRELALHPPGTTKEAGATRAEIDRAAEGAWVTGTKGSAVCSPSKK
jgi:predicted transcriptional regulator